MVIAAWLRELGLERYEQAFRDNDIDARILQTLSADDLRELGVASLGHRKTLLKAIAQLGDTERPRVATGLDGPATASLQVRSEVLRLTNRSAKVLGRSCNGPTRHFVRRHQLLSKVTT